MAGHRSPSPQLLEGEARGPRRGDRRGRGATERERPPGLAEEDDGGVQGEGSSSSSSSRINVVVRCRPLAESERCGGSQDICRVMDKKLVILLDPATAASNDYLRADKTREKRFAFDHAFGPEVGTQELFEAATKPLIGAVMQAYNATVFAYGSTGAGKTFTMIGTQKDPGVMLRTVKELFDEASEVHSGDSGRTVSIRCSFIEVYNENLLDLLATDGNEPLIDLRDDPEKGTIVAGITETEAESADEVLELLHAGNRRRTTEPTAMNVTSSRSHAVLQVVVQQRGRDGTTLTGKLSMIDLAGSERASQTENRGARLLEGANINRSLLALGNCISALASGSAFVPYRDSKLTRLLKDSLGGNCRTVMVANVSPNHVSYEDTLNTLKYANRAKNIRVSAQQNIVEPDAHVSQYEKAIADLRSEVSLLKARLAKRQTAPGGRQALAGWQEEEDAEEAEQDGSGVQEASENWKIEVVRNLEGRTQLQRSLIEVDRGLSRWRVEQAQAREAIDGWNESQGSSSPYTPRTVARRARPSVPTLEDWKDQLSQIEESIREHEDTRRKIEEKLDQNKVQGKELHAQLAQRVLNEDLRAFLEMIQRVQVLEVERLELDHLWERQRSQLEERDQEIVMLREQLRLRNVHIGEQRELLSAERQQLLPLPGRVSLLGTTLAQGSPGQQRGPLRVMQAWAPPPTKDQDEVPTLSSRPLRATSPRPRSPGLEGQKPGGEFPIGDLAPQLPCPGLPINWRNLELPKASQIHGIARIFADGGALGLAGKGWREPPPPVLSPGRFRPGRGGDAGADERAPPDRLVTGVAELASHRTKSGPRSPLTLPRGRTCPPRPDGTRPEGHRLSSELEESADPPRRSGHRPPAVARHSDLRMHGVAAPAHAAPMRPWGMNDKALGPGRRGLRARSEQPVPSRMGRVGRIVVNSPAR